MIILAWYVKFSQEMLFVLDFLFPELKLIGRFANLFCKDTNGANFDFTAVN